MKAAVVALMLVTSAARADDARWLDRQPASERDANARRAGVELTDLSPTSPLIEALTTMPVLTREALTKSLGPASHAGLAYEEVWTAWWFQSGFTVHLNAVEPSQHHVVLTSTATPASPEPLLPAPLATLLTASCSTAVRAAGRPSRIVPAELATDFSWQTLAPARLIELRLTCDGATVTSLTLSWRVRDEALLTTLRERSKSAAPASTAPAIDKSAPWALGFSPGTPFAVVEARLGTPRYVADGGMGEVNVAWIPGWSWRFDIQGRLVRIDAGELGGLLRDAATASYPATDLAAIAALEPDPVAGLVAILGPGQVNLDGGRQLRMATTWLSKRPSPTWGVSVVTRSPDDPRLLNATLYAALPEPAKAPATTPLAKAKKSPEIKWLTGIASNATADAWVRKLGPPATVDGVAYDPHMPVRKKNAGYIDWTDGFTVSDNDSRTITIRVQALPFLRDRGLGGAALDLLGEPLPHLIERLGDPYYQRRDDSDWRASWRTPIGEIDVECSGPMLRCNKLVMSLSGRGL